MRTAARNWDLWRAARWALGVLAVGVGLLLARGAPAQNAAQPLELATPDELAEIVGPIALYPDDLVGIVLPASTYPLQVVQAARFLEDRKGNATLTPDEDWDDSVVALLNYPEVVQLLNDDLDWTYDLGTAVLNQRADVLDAIQAFRDRAYAAGNLTSDARQTVSRDDGAIAIKPANPQVIYVPYYAPERVVVYQTTPVYHYYPWRYPVYYYPYPSSYVFDTGFFWGVRSWFSIGWHSRFLHVYDYGYHLHPYYGRSYYDPWYVRNVYINVNVNRDYVWEPRYRYGGRPVVRGYEGRVYTPREAPRVNRGSAPTYRSQSTEGSVTRESTARSAGTETRRSGGVAGSAYRDRSSPTTQRGAVDTARTQPDRSVEGGSEQTERSATSRGARQSYRTAPQSRPSPGRALGGSTGLPREATRGVEPRPAPRSDRAVSQSAEPRGGNSAPRGDGGSQRGGGGSYRGGGRDTGGSYRNGAPQQ